MLTGYAELDLAEGFTLIEKGVGRAGEFIEADEVCGVVRVLAVAEGDGLAIKIIKEVLDVLDVLVDDEEAVLRELLGEFLEAVANVVDVLKEVEVIGFYVQNDFNRREEA